MSTARSGGSYRSGRAPAPTASSSLLPNTGRAWPLATSANTAFDNVTRELRYRPPSGEPAAPSQPVVAKHHHQQQQQQQQRPQQVERPVSPPRSIPASAVTRRSANTNRNIPFHTRIPAPSGLVLPPASARGTSLPVFASSRVGHELQQTSQVPPRASSLSASRGPQSSPTAQSPTARTHAGVQPTPQHRPPYQQQVQVQKQTSHLSLQPTNSARRSAGAQTSPTSATPRLSVSASPPVSAQRHTSHRRSSAGAPAAPEASSSPYVGSGYNQYPPAPAQRLISGSSASSSADVRQAPRHTSPLPYQPQASHASTALAPAAAFQQQQQHRVYREAMTAIPTARSSLPRQWQAAAADDAAWQQLPESHHQRRTTSPPIMIPPAPYRGDGAVGVATTAGSVPSSVPMRPSPPAVRASSAVRHGRQPPMPPPHQHHYPDQGQHQPSPPAQQPQPQPQSQPTYYELAPSLQLTRHRHVRRLIAGELHAGDDRTAPLQERPQLLNAPRPLVFVPQGRAPPPPPQAHGTTTTTTAHPARPPSYPSNGDVNRKNSGGPSGAAARSTQADDTDSLGSDTSSTRSGRTRHVLRRGRVAATSVIPQGSPYGTAPMYAVPRPLYHTTTATHPPAPPPSTRAQPPGAPDATRRQPAHSTEAPPAPLVPSATPASPPTAAPVADARRGPTPQQQQQSTTAAARLGQVSDWGRHPAIAPTRADGSTNEEGAPFTRPSTTHTTNNNVNIDSDAAASALPATVQSPPATVAAPDTGTAFAASLLADSSVEEREAGGGGGDGGDSGSPLNGQRPLHSTATVTSTSRATTSPPWQTSSLPASDVIPVPPHDTTAPPQDGTEGELTASVTGDTSYGDAAPTSAASPLDRPISSRSRDAAPHSVLALAPLQARAVPHPSTGELRVTGTARSEQGQDAEGHDTATASLPRSSHLMPALVQPLDPAEMALQPASLVSDHTHMHHTMTPERSDARWGSPHSNTDLLSEFDEPRDVDVDAAPATEDENVGSLSDRDSRLPGGRYTAHQPGQQCDANALTPVEKYVPHVDEASAQLSTAGDDNTETPHGAEHTQRPAKSLSTTSRDVSPEALRESLERDLLLSGDSGVVGLSPLAVGERDGYVDPLEEASMDAAYMLDTLEQQYVRINEETKEEMEDVVHVVELNRRNRAAGVPRTFVPKGQFSDVLPLLRYPVPDDKTPETPATQLTYLPLSDTAYTNVCAVVWLSRFNSAEARNLLAKAQQQQQHLGAAGSDDDDEESSAAAANVPANHLDNPAAGLLDELDARIAAHVRGFVQEMAGGAPEGTAAFTAACVALTDHDNISCVRADVWANAAAGALSLADHVTNVLLSATVPREAERRRALAARMTSPVEAAARTMWTYFLGASPWNYEEVVENDVHAAMPTAAARLAYAFMFKARMRNLDGGLGSLMFSMLSEQVPEATFLDGLLLQEKLRLALHASAANVVACTTLRRQAARAAAGGDTKAPTHMSNGVHERGSSSSGPVAVAAGAAPTASTTPRPRESTIAPAERSGSENTVAAEPKWTSPVLTAYLTYSEGTAGGAAATAASPQQQQQHRRSVGSPESLHLDESARPPPSKTVTSASSGRASSSPADADRLNAAGGATLPMDAELACGGNNDDDDVADLYSVAVQLNFLFPTKTERGMHQLCAALIEDLVVMEALPVPEEVQTPDGTVLTDRTSIVDALVAEGAQAMRHIIVSLSSRRDAAVMAVTADAYRTPAGAIDTAALRSDMEDCLIVFDPAVMYFLATPVPVDALFEYSVTDGPPSMQPQLTGRKSAFVEVLRLQHVAETVQYAMEMQDAILVAGQYNHLVATHMRHDAQQQQQQGQGHQAGDAVLLDHMTNTEDAALLAELDPARAAQLQQRDHNASTDKLLLLDPNTSLEGCDVSVRAVLMALCLADPAKPIQEVQEYLRHLLVLYFELHAEDGTAVDSGDAQQLALARLVTAELTMMDWFGETTETGTLVHGASPAACDRVRVDAEELASLCPRVLGRRVGLPSATMADAAAAVISASTHGIHVDGDDGADDDADSVRVAESAPRLPNRA